MQRQIFSEEYQNFRSEVKKFLEREAVPMHETWEKQGCVDRAFWLKAGELGILCPHLSEEYGGAGGSFLHSAIIIEEIARLGLTGIGFPLHSDIVAPYILHYGSEEMKQKYLPKMVSGEKISSIAMTEPGAGSDLQAIQTTAVLSGDHYIVNGAKTFITNGQSCDFSIVAVKTDSAAGAKGISLVLMDCDAQGFSKGKNFAKVGMKAQDTSELFFKDVKVPRNQLLGQEGHGFAYLMRELPQERLVVGISAVAAAQAALEGTVTYVKERQAFGKTLFDLQNTRFCLADLAAQITSAQCFSDYCVEMHLKQKLDVATAAKLKLLTTELQCRVVDECLQLYGGYGYMLEYPIARAWVDARVQKIYAGTSEIMKEIIARSL